MEKGTLFDLHNALVLLSLLRFIVLPQDEWTGGVDLRSTVRVCDPNIEKGILTPAPKKLEP